MAEGFGSVTWWGYSPAVDLSAVAAEGQRRGRKRELSSLEEVIVQSDSVNILLVGAGDLRHVMATAAQHRDKPLHFYIAESCLEVLARHMLFLSLLLEPPHKLGLQEKAELFLELYGNSLLRAQTSDYLREKASELIKVVTDLDYQKTCLPLLDISSLKFKERDLLEGIFKFWRLADNGTFDMAKHWDGRVRSYLSTRYDSRSGVFDWDYHMKLQELAPAVNAKEYSKWRECGVAFQLREDAPYDNANRTLASGMLVSQGGQRIATRGYWGDIVVSPYLSFGIESSNKELLKTVNGKPVKTSATVSEYNLLSLTHTLTTGDNYPPPDQATPTNPLGTIEEIEEEEEEEEEEHHTESGCHGDHSMKGPLLDGSCRLTFLPVKSVGEIGRKAKFRKLFNIAFFSNSMVHYLGEECGLQETFAPDSVLVLETARFMLDLNREQKAEYVKRVSGMAHSIGFKEPLHSEDSSYLAFIA